MVSWSQYVPEIFLGVAILSLIIIGVWQQDKTQSYIRVTRITHLVLLVLTVFFLYLLITPPHLSQIPITDNQLELFVKLLVVLFSNWCLWVAPQYLTAYKINHFEFPLLILFAVLGMLLMISAENLLVLYLGLELQSLSFYVLTAISRENLRATEAGVKYFVLGALASGFFLYGSSIIYGATGYINYQPIQAYLAVSPQLSFMMIIGMVFVLASFAFKMSAAPFHMWTPDVYEGAPTPVTAFFAIVPKVVVITVLINFITYVLGEFVIEWQQIIIFISLLSMAIGAIAAIGQQNIKRLLAYSSIGHIGYALLGVITANESGYIQVYVYMLVYMLTSVGVFACVLQCKNKERMCETIDDLAGLSKTQPLFALAIALFMLSLAGLPPLVGFFAKLSIFMVVVKSGFYGLAIFAVLASVVAAYYYLRIVKIMYFDEPMEKFDNKMPKHMVFTIAITAIFVISGLLYFNQIVNLVTSVFE